VQKGREWEAKVKIFLEQQGLKIVGKNFYTRQGEVDLIAVKGDTLIFIEVKYRNTDLYGYAEEAVNAQKIKKMYKTATKYIEKIKWQENVRFDVVAITKNNINWIKNSFWGDEIGI
jgi:putative endonuclease